jgi:hypothetical protein
VVFGVVDQNRGDQRGQVDALPFRKQIRYVHVDILDTLGVCWARNIAFSLYNEEDFLLQIDSHTLFEQGWDSRLLEQFAGLRSRSERPIISTYPYGFEFDDEDHPVAKVRADRTVLVLRPHPDTRLTEESCVLRFRAEHVTSEVPLAGCSLAGGFLFTAGAFIEEIPYDPFLYFHGEEQSLAIRAYTRGWDIFHPKHIPLYHLYKRPNTEHLEHHWHKSVEGDRALDYATLKKRAIHRLNRIFYGDGMTHSPYGLGSVRPMEHFIEFSGIDYRNRVIREPNRPS